jgi:hypothetical protein
MGLDMYAYATNQKPERSVDFKDESEDQLHYWRKHPNLHGFMECLYYQKGGQAESFNCVNVELTSDDLDILETAIKDNLLPPTCGFFFGETDGSEHEDDLAFVAEARAAIAEGRHVYYTSWW